MKPLTILLASVLLYSSCSKKESSPSLPERGTFGGHSVSAKPDSSESPVGYAMMNGATTGGTGGPSVTVTTYAGLKAIAERDDAPTTIMVSGTITGTVQILVRSNKSIIGLPGAVLDGVGLRLATVSNIIIQNLAIKNVVQDNGSGDQDAITLKYSTDHVWIDHCDLSTPVLFDPGGNSEYYDGLLDINRDCDFITCSWTKFSNSWKGTLVGLEDDPLGKLHVTYHHCYFYNILERAPLACRAVIHSFNNYFVNNTVTGHLGYSIDAFESSVVRTDNNYWDNTVTAEGGGTNISTPITTRDQTPGTISGLGTDTFVTSKPNHISTPASNWIPEYSYAAWLTPVVNVPSVVLERVGPYSPKNPPVIVIQPKSQTAASGSFVRMSVAATGGSDQARLGYQWKKNGVPITGATAYSISGSVLDANAATYTVTVTNAAGSVTSSPATLTVTHQ